MSEVKVDREFAEKFLQSVDDPLGYGVYFLFHDWWDEAPQSAIDEYVAELQKEPGAAEFLSERFLAEPLTLDRLSQCAPGTLGRLYHDFIVKNKLEQNLGRNYKAFNEELQKSGKLKRLPEDLSFTIVRGFQIHDIMHVLTGFQATHYGELALASFYLAQLRFPYHAMRMAVTTAHMAYVSPKIIPWAMDAIAEGWQFGRATQNLQFARWEDEIDTPLADLRAKWGLHTQTMAA